MNIDTFMNVLTVLILVFGGMYVAARIMGKYLGTWPPKVYHPFAIRGYVKSAWRVFPQLKRIGILLCIIMVLNFALGNLIVFGEINRSMNEMLKYLSGYRTKEFSQYLIDAIKLTHGALFHTTWYVFYILDVAGSLTLVLLLVYLMNRWRRDLAVELRDRVVKVSLFLLCGSTLISAWFVLTFEGYIRSYLGGEALSTFIIGYVGNLNTFMQYADYAVTNLSASIAEGVLISLIFAAYAGKSFSLKDAFGTTLKALPALFIFNAFYYVLPKLSVHLCQRLFVTHEPNAPVLVSADAVGHIVSNVYLDAFLWLGSALFFLTPFIIIKDGIKLKAALKKNLVALSRAPADYFTVYFITCIAAEFVALIAGMFRDYILIPVALHYEFGPILTIERILLLLFFMWFSLFAFCVFAAFAREKFLYEGSE